MIEGVHCSVQCTMYIHSGVYFCGVVGCGEGGGVCVQKARTNVCVDNNGNPDLHGNMCKLYSLLIKHSEGRRGSYTSRPANF